MSDKDLSKKAANEQLMPCPFCGERAYIVQHHYITAGEAYGVRCFCGAQSDQFFETMGEAVAAWNTRVSVPHETTAKELLLIEERMRQNDADAYTEYCDRLWALLDSISYMDDAIDYAEKWAKEHPEEANHD